jgi:DNA-binding GntR family transcriptional regulator
MTASHIPSLEPQKPLGDQVYERLRQHVISGELPPGTWLRHEDLAQQLGVSHTPVRGALDRLVTEGLAEKVPYKGVRVVEYSPDEIAELYALRLLLEPIATRLAAQNVRLDELAELEDLLQQSRELGRSRDLTGRRELNRRFHATILSASQSPHLSRLLEWVNNRFPDWMIYEGMQRQPDLLEQRLQREDEQHRALYDLLAAGKAEEAERVAAEHVSEVADEIVTLLNVPQDLLTSHCKRLWPIHMSGN